MTPNAEPSAPAEGRDGRLEEAAGRTRFAALGRASLAAFWRELPRLLQERPRQWVAYHGDRRLGFAATRAELWQECLRQGLRPEEFLIRSIEPEDPDVASGSFEADPTPRPQ
jgi:hypothetical protein